MTLPFTSKAAKRQLWLILFIYFCTGERPCQAKSTTPEANPDGITYTFKKQLDQDIRPANSSTFGGNIEEIIGSSFLQANLKRGMVALDRSMHSLMESIFYSILDQDVQAKISPNNFFQFGTRRKLYRSRLGKWVVADRVFLGPRANRHLGVIGPKEVKIILAREVPLPIGLDAESIVSFVEIYPSDSARPLSEKITKGKTTPFIRNWFGMLPLMEAVLPLVFNPMEMYDPLHLLEVPFLYPRTVEAFADMPTGNIRSTSLQGGIRLPIILKMFSGSGWEAFVEKSNIQENGLSSVFFEGSYSIHVLKISDEQAKIGITWYRSKGLQFSTQLASTLYLFANSIPKMSYEGAPVYFMPIRANWKLEDIFEKKFVVDVDLRSEHGKKCYQAATLGDLSLAQPDSADCSLSFDFEFEGNKKQFGMRKNILISQSKNKSTRKKGIEKIRLNDRKLQQYSYTYLYEQEFQNSLFGSWSETYRAKTIQPKSEEGVQITKKDPKIEMSLQISDHALYADELKEILRRVKPLIPFELKTSLPPIPLRDKSAVREQQKAFRTLSARERGQKIHSLPQKLGHLDLNLIFLLDLDIIEKLVKTPAKNIWKNIFSGYPIYPSILPEPRLTSVGHRVLTWVPFATGELLETFYIEANWLKIPYQSISRFDALMNLKDKLYTKDKTEYTDNLGILSESSMPQQWMEALAKWIGFEHIPAKLFLDIQPSSKASLDAKLLLAKYQDRTWQTPAYQETLDESIEDPSSVFHPESVGIYNQRPHIQKVQLYFESLDSLAVDIWVDDLSPEFSAENQKLMTYIQLEKNSWLRVSLNRNTNQIFEAEKVFDMQTDLLHYKIIIPFKDNIFQSFIQNRDSFRMNISVSEDGNTWSNDETIFFHNNRGLLSKKSTD